MKTHLIATGLLAAAVISAPAVAHDAWAEPVPIYRLSFGHLDTGPEDYPHHRVMSLQVLDESGQDIDYQLLDGPDGALIYADAPASLILAVIDNGLWTRTAAQGYRRGAPKAFSGAQETRNFIKYGKSVLRWHADATRAVGHKLELVPLGRPQVGEPLRVTVLFDGQPLPGASISHGYGDNERLVTADDNGRAQLRVDTLPIQFAARHDAPALDSDGYGLAATLYLGAE